MQFLGPLNCFESVARFADDLPVWPGLQPGSDLAAPLRKIPRRVFAKFIGERGIGAFIFQRLRSAISNYEHAKGLLGPFHPASRNSN